MKLYVDGALSASATAAFTSAGTNTSTLDIGRSGTTSYFGGSLDELALYGSALSAAQVVDHYAKGLNAATVTGYGYDANGNETSAGSATLTYDLANRLKTYAAAGTTISYAYDGDGNRLQASTGSLAAQKTNFLWDTSFALPQLALERDGTNTLLRRYLYGERRISMTTPGGNFYYHYDPLGSTTNLTNATGATQWTELYEPYGTIRTETKNDPAAPANLIKFAGEYADPTGLYYLRARQYDASVGRFIQRDPLQSDAGVPPGSAYAYVADNPVARLDPSGMTLEPSQAASSFAAQTTSPAWVIADASGRRLASLFPSPVPGRRILVEISQMLNRDIQVTISGLANFGRIAHGHYSIFRDEVPVVLEEPITFPDHGNSVSHQFTCEPGQWSAVASARQNDGGTLEGEASASFDSEDCVKRQTKHKKKQRTIIAPVPGNVPVIIWVPM